MCLDTIDSEIKPATFGYKVYNKIDGKLFGSIYGGPYKEEKWLKSSNIIIRSFKNTKYKSGFHVFRTLRGAKKWGIMGQRIYKIEIDSNSIMATGKQDFCEVIVAQRIKILKESKVTAL